LWVPHPSVLRVGDVAVGGTKQLGRVSKCCMRTRLQILLPAVIGLVNAPLVIWDIYNARVVASVGMGWDMGAPIWPYQTSDILLRLLNFPAYFVAQPIANALDLAAPRHLFLIVPTALAWWWLVGMRLDHRLRPPRSHRGWLRFAAFTIFCLLLLSAALIMSADYLRLWLRYGGHFWNIASLLLFVRFLTPSLWCVTLAVSSVIAAKKAVARTHSEDTKIAR
jgi:hypothetical protein